MNSSIDNPHYSVLALIHTKTHSINTKRIKTDHGYYLARAQKRDYAWWNWREWKV